MSHPSIRPRRSALYMPGSNARALEKARTLDADVLIFDLEDAVADSQKTVARDQVVAALKTGGYKAETVVRINDPASATGGADIKAIARSGCDAVLLPKIEKPRDVRDAHLRLAAAGAPPSMAIWAMIETPLAVLHVEEIAFSSPHLKCLVMGTSDLAKDLRARHTPMRLPFLTLLSLCVLAARAAGLTILDGVHLDLADEQGFLETCRQGSELGFDGKTLLHPKTIAAANAAFGPTPEEIAWAKKITTAHADAVKQGKGVLVVDGKFIESLHVEGAKHTLALAESIQKRG
ncbi:MAG TPA: CoA ester lyase [Alphaproteobacteria bacterium]|nr:CoA ester lyase [Alphaproteobacteria bacterium]